MNGTCASPSEPKGTPREDEASAPTVYIRLTKDPRDLRAGLMRLGRKVRGEER